MRMRVPGVAILSLALVAGAEAQPNVEEQARRQLESGRDFFRAGRYAEALKDFETVAEGYPTSRVADDALLAIAEYQLDIARDPTVARATAETLFRRYATADAAPMGYVIAGRATMELDPSLAGLDSALASFDRVPRLFPGSDAVAPALFYGAEVMRRAGRAPESLDRLRDVALQFPRSVWAARASLLEARLLVAASQPVEAMGVLQRIVRRFPGSEEARAAVEQNTILWRLHLRGGQAPFRDSGQSLTGRSDRLRDIEALAVLPGGSIAVAGRPGVLVMSPDGEILRQAPVREPRQLAADGSGRLLIVQKAVISRETEKGLQRLALTAVQSGQPRLLQNITAGAILPAGDVLVADRDLRAVARFAPDGRFLSNFATGRMRRIVVGPAEQVALLEEDSRGVSIADRTGAVLARLAARGASYDLSSAQDLAFDVLGHLYVLVRDGVVVFGPDAQPLLTFSAGPAGFRNARALALDPSGRLYVYDDDLDRVLIYQ